jgi:pimeloyl-ACP methyl ester carboxylesterase
VIELLGQRARVFCVERGLGPPTLFLHGNPDSADVWSQVIDRLPQLRCLAPDLPGFGRTVASDDYPYALDSMAEFAVALLDAMGVVEPANLVVHDAGGFFGLATATRYPERIRRLVVLNTFFFADYRYHFWARVCRTPLIGELGMAVLNRPLYGLEMRRGSSAIDDGYVKESYRCITPGMKRQVLRMYRALDPSCFKGWEDRMRAALANVPTLVLWGDRDPYIPTRTADRFGGDVRHFNCGHWLHVEQAALVAKNLREFLS